MLLWCAQLHLAQQATGAAKRVPPAQRFTKARRASSRWEARPQTYKVSFRERQLHREAMAALRSPDRADKGLQMLHQGVEDWPNNPFFPHSLGMHYWRNRATHAEARQWFQHTLGLDDQNPVALVAFAKFLAQQDTPEAAREMFGRATQVCHSSKWTACALHTVHALSAVLSSVIDPTQVTHHKHICPVSMQHICQSDGSFLTSSVPFAGVHLASITKIDSRNAGRATPSSSMARMGRL